MRPARQSRSDEVVDGSAAYSGRVTVTPLSPAEIIAHGEQAGVLVRTEHPLGDVLGYSSEQAVLQSYYRNNVVHLFAAASWVACCFQNNRRLSRAAVEKLGRGLYPFVQSELFLPWDADEFAARIQATIELLIQRGLFTFDAETAMLQRGPGQTDEVFQLRVIAHSLQQAFERYYIAIAILVKNGSGVLGSGELENLCQLTAQRLSLLYSQTAPSSSTAVCSVASSASCVSLASCGWTPTANWHSMKRWRVGPRMRA